MSQEGGPVSKRIRIYDLELRHCRWPTSEEGGVTYCGHRTQERSSYCPDHHIVAYIPFDDIDIIEVEQKENAP